MISVGFIIWNAGLYVQSIHMCILNLFDRTKITKMQRITESFSLITSFLQFIFELNNSSLDFIIFANKTDPTFFKFCQLGSSLDLFVLPLPIYFLDSLSVKQQRFSIKRYLKVYWLVIIVMQQFSTHLPLSSLNCNFLDWEQASLFS